MPGISPAAALRLSHVPIARVCSMDRPELAAASNQWGIRPTWLRPLMQRNRHLSGPVSEGHHDDARYRAERRAHCTAHDAIPFLWTPRSCCCPAR
jgi:hypothetical protein